MFRRRLIAALVAATLATPLQAGEPASYVQLQVTAVEVVVRAAPRADAPRIGTLTRGALAEVLEVTDDWVQVDLGAGAGVGWLHRGSIDDETVALFTAAERLRSARDAAGSERDDSRARPGPGRSAQADVRLPAIDPSQVEPPKPLLPRESVSIPDRWRLMQALGFKFPKYDPYNQNPLKGDLPLPGTQDMFFNFGAISDSLFEFRRLPTPVAGQSGARSGANDPFGDERQRIFAQNLIFSFSLQKGNTTFRPPDYEFKFVPVVNYNRAEVHEVGALRTDPRYGTSRNDSHVAVQELFVDYHLRNVSDRYDFDSVRVGIQPFTADFRGFLFIDSPVGVRLFGTRDNNTLQYNVAAFRRVEKDTNSGLNHIGERLRDDDVFVANVYFQDWPRIGYTSQLTALHNRNREGDRRYYDANGFLARPALVGNARLHNYDVTYLGYNGDGHFGRWNLTTSTYYAFGRDSYNPIAQRSQRIEAGFHASELSRDFDWIRLRGNFLVASGDKDPYDGRATGFDAVFENPQFAGADTSFFIRQAIPFIGGGGVGLSGRNGILPALRSSKELGQSNFVNPGLMLYGTGADFDVRPDLRLFANVSRLLFMNTTVLGVLRNQAPPSRDLGTDWSVGFHWRPYLNQNVIVNGSLAVLEPGRGLRDLYPDGSGASHRYSAVLNVVLTF